MKQWAVYKHTSPSGKVYVGITSWSINHRWENGAGYPSRCRLFHRAIQKYEFIKIVK